MSNNTINDMKFEKDQKVKLVDSSSGEVYRIITLFPDRTIQLGEQDVSIQPTSGSQTRTVKRKQLRRLTDEEKKEQRSNSRSAPPRRDQSKKVPSQPASAAKQPSQETVAKQMEDAPPAAADKPAGTEPISTAPSSDAPVQTSENSLTPQTDDAANAINPSLPVSSSTLELKDIERIVDEAFVRRDAEMKAIPVLYSFVRGLVEKLTGKSDSLPNATGTSTKGLQTALEQLKDEVKKLEGERDSAKDNALQLTDELNTEKETSKQFQTDLNGEESRNGIAKTKWETEKGTLNGKIASEKRRAGEAEAESKKWQTKLEGSEQTLKDALNDFWKGRQEFYGGLHRSIIDLYREEDRGRRQSSIDTRFDALQADINLLTSLGCQVMLDREALDFGRCSFDPFFHEPSSEDRGIPSGEMATVFLPGWTYGDPPTKVRPILGRQEINQ